MELGAFGAALVRRWYLALVVLALAAGACVLTVSSIGPTYETQATVLLFPPPGEEEAQDEPAASNPYLELSGLTTARDILIRRLTSQSARDALADAFPQADYALAPDGTSSGPIVVVEVSGPTAQVALGAQAALLGSVPGALADLQAGLGLSGTELITARELTVDDRAEAAHKSQIRAGIVATGGVLGLGLALIGLLDGLLAARATARAERSADQHDTTGEDAEDDGPALPVADPFMEDDADEDPVRVHEAADEASDEAADADDEPDLPPARPRLVGAPAADRDPAPRTARSKQARKQARRLARDEAQRAAREQARREVRELARTRP